MRWTEVSVPVQTRVTAWVSSAVVGVAMYFVFVSMLKAAPALEREEVRGKIEAIMARALAAPTKLSAEEAKAAVAESRATSSVLWALHKREADLDQTCRAKRFWAALIGLVAGGGCFALCSVYWLGRGVREAAVPELSAGGRRSSEAA